MTDQIDYRVILDRTGMSERDLRRRFSWNLVAGAILIPLFGLAYTIFAIHHMGLDRDLCGSYEGRGGVWLTVDGYPCQVELYYLVGNALFFGTMVSPAPILIIYLANQVLGIRRASGAHGLGLESGLGPGGAPHPWARFMLNVAICAALSVSAGALINYWVYDIIWLATLFPAGNLSLFVALGMYYYSYRREIAASRSTKWVDKVFD